MQWPLGLYLYTLLTYSVLLECFTSSVEVVFLVDGSSSIGEVNFKLVKQWVINSTRELIATFGETVRTQVVQYSEKP